MSIWEVVVVTTIIYIHGNDGFVLLYDTEDQNFVQYNNCIYSTKESEISYCERNKLSSRFIRQKQNNCLHNGKKWLFSTLLEHNITPSEVLKWSSTVQMADNYASVYYNNSTYTDTTFLCNCTIPSTFGKYCEYRLTHNSTTFEESMIVQFATKEKHQLELQTIVWGARYYGILCDAGLLGLDWRHICNGNQECMDGYDEENCDLLEFNECEENQYRCINGMCIDEEFWLDGDKDCMDWSDETDYTSYSLKCPFTLNNMDCDEHLCLYHEWSCGDGQCIVRAYRFPFYPAADEYGCYNFRESRHMCETNNFVPMWTEYPVQFNDSPTAFGSCWLDSRYKEKNYNYLTTQHEKCIYLIRCALTNGFGDSCPCGRTGQTRCRELMTNLCRNRRYPYPPPKSIDVPIQTYYNGSRDWHERVPDIIVVSGSVKCRGYRGVLLQPREGILDEDKIIGLSNGVDTELCRIPDIYRDFNSSFQFDKFCWKNSSRTFNNQSYAFKDVCQKHGQCISQYRITDGYFDCVGYEPNDEEILEASFMHTQVPKHRFCCSEQQKTALPVIALGNLETTCSNQYDEYLYGSRVTINEIQCENREDIGCTILKEYIRNSSFANFSAYEAFHRQADSRMPFHYYCDSFWHQNNHFDESSKHCQNWVCNDDEYQCQTGQCIQLSWVCDGEWDCSDASDEEALLLITNWTLHNQMLEELNHRSTICYDRYSIQPFSDICNITFEFPCLLNNVDNPLDIENHRPCINLTQIGDGIQNCHNAYDERNTFSAKNVWEMIGMGLLCADHSIRPELSCRKFLDTCDDDPLCFYVSKNQSWCSGPKDVVCLNGSCAIDARCNRIFECSHGEDEYWCVLNYGQNYYREEKFLSRSERPLNLQSLLSSILISPTIATSESVIPMKNVHTTYDNYISSFVCNRGIAVYDRENIQVCFCSAAYHGELCHYHSDRISIIVHLDLTSFNQTEIPIFYVKSNLLFHNNITDHHEFHIVPTFEFQTYTKHRFYLTYSITKSTINQREDRYLNRSDVINNHPYSIHFDIYALFDDMKILEIGSWRYPIYFDYLPSHRFALVLRFPLWFSMNNTDNCGNVSCSPNSTCKPIFNQNDSVYCSCNHGFYGPKCQKYQTKCNSYCSSDSFCLPDGRGKLTNTNNPFCLCPRNRFGPRCNLRRDQCSVSSCQNNGTCHLTYDKSGQNPFVCACLKEFSGRYCQYRKTAIRIILNLTATAHISLIQFYNVMKSTHELVIRNQLLIHGFPSSIHYGHDQLLAPVCAIMKLYDERPSDVRYFILFIEPNSTTNNITSTPKHCPHISSLLYMHDEIIFQYHQICQNDTQRFCFYDEIYLCICRDDHKRVECSSHDPFVERCSSCLAGGTCIKEDVQNSGKFICLCPYCYQGHQCQFSLELFGFTLDLLIASDSIKLQYIYISIIVLIFIIGAFNNLCSFVTFKRPKPRKVGVGNYLFLISILNQCALFCLLCKFVHILLGNWHHTNNESCKITSYLLSVVTRSTYWMASWITIDRLGMTILPTALAWKSPRLAIKKSIVTCLIILSMHIHELFYYTVISQPDFSMEFCVTDFNQSIAKNYNSINTLVHSIVPFLIQVMSITLLIIFISRNKTNLAAEHITYKQILQKQFEQQKELYITPLIHIVSSLPSVILAFTLACAQMNNLQRHFLLVAYLFSYIPSMLGFIVYVLPSRTYKEQFMQTSLGKKYLKAFMKTA